ncbi:hypothetical protein V1525DRAFT_448775 [Lipomyces kononenkoae]|uniref:Uncharacterized protein n=1 Tax=Lipomyces kononenkoae TaxID=34357 RepID=A0ACC3T6Z7_LIPKO
MASAASTGGGIDSAQKSLIETLTTILKLSNGLISIPIPYGIYASEVISLALTLLQYSYNPILFSNDLWTNLTNDGRKIDELSNFLLPVGAPFRRVLAVTAIAPKTNLTWDGAARDFRQSELLMTVLESWTKQIFYNMLLPLMAKGRTPTPSEAGSGPRRRQWSLKRLVSVKEMMDENAPADIMPVRAGYGSVTLQPAHIIPFSASRNSVLQAMLSKYVDKDVRILFSDDNINDPSNALLLDSLTHSAFSSFKFSIECQSGRYIFRKLAPNRKLHTFVLRHREGEEITFGHQSRDVTVPSRLICNIHHSIGRVLWMSGAAENIIKALADEDELNDGHLDGDYWDQVTSSYLQRQLRALSDLDELAINEHDERLESDPTI